MGDLNMTTENTLLNDLFQIYDLTVFIKKPTYYQSQNCIDHLLTNQKTSFKYVKVFSFVCSFVHDV